MNVFLSLILLGFSAFAAPEINPVQGDLFMSTEEVPTPQGKAHLEVQSYAINSEADLNRVMRELLEKTHLSSNTNEHFYLEVGTTDYKYTKLETTAKVGVAQIDASIKAAGRLDPKSIKVDPPQGFFKKHYNLTLAFVRFVANSATVTSGLVLGKGVSIEHALVIGALAGSLSAGVQLKSDAVFKWLSNSVRLVNVAKKLGLIPKNRETPGTDEKILRQVEMYGRWAMLEAGFLLACRTAMSLLNIPVAENLFLTLGKSTLSQGVFEIGVLKGGEVLEQMNPKWSSKAAAFKHVSMFAGSGISVLAAIGSMVDIPFANLGFVVLTGTGVVLNFSSKLVRMRPIEELLVRWKVSKLRCELLFN